MVDFLHKKGFTDITEDLNQKLTDEEYNLLLAEYNSDKIIREEADRFLQSNLDIESYYKSISSKSEDPNEKTAQETPVEMKDSISEEINQGEIIKEHEKKELQFKQNRELLKERILGIVDDDTTGISFDNAEKEDNGSVETSNKKKKMEQKKGLRRLGYVFNYYPNEKNENYLTYLNNLIEEPVTETELTDFIESDQFKQVFLNENGDECSKEEATSFSFQIPWKDKENNSPIYGTFSKNDKGFAGVIWKSRTTKANTKDIRELKNLGFIPDSCWDELSDLCGQELNINTISNYVTTDYIYYNAAGYTEFENGTVVNSETGKYILFHTSLKNNDDEIIVGWFTKESHYTGGGYQYKYEGIDWGTEADFFKNQKQKYELRTKACFGHWLFDSDSKMEKFLKDLKDSCLEEPWSFDENDDREFPILRSYIEYELDRLFYEQDVLKYQNRIVYNDKKTKALFNTNLINTYGDDLKIAGDFIQLAGNYYISNPVIAHSVGQIIKMGFDPKNEPMTPKFFKDINEIIFHSEWLIDDQDTESLDHIIKKRRYRFPEEYRSLSNHDLSQKLKGAINFAKKIAQRNYKFIVPMYYPKANRIQLLMPIYLNTRYSDKPDFALVLTPFPQENGDGYYELETILQLNEVYQDARLIAKPDESWLNPKIIKQSL